MSSATNVDDNDIPLTRTLGLVIATQSVEPLSTPETTTHAFVYNRTTSTLSHTEVPAAVLDDKSGPLPASKESIEAMPRLKITKDDHSSFVEECAICLEEIGVGSEVREMPCKHGFHSDCIETWLGIRGSCPVCRFTMPGSHGDGNDETGRRQRRRNLVAFIVIERDGSGSGPASEE